jgi:DNA polymerase/3'-5' exonuclease PolX
MIEVTQERTALIWPILREVYVLEKNEYKKKAYHCAYSNIRSKGRTKKYYEQVEGVCKDIARSIKEIMQTSTCRRLQELQN